MSPRTGRRPGDVDTRQEILDAALALFTRHGYDRTSMRAVARAAGVDPALLHHYFDGKADLFRAALALPIDPAQLLPGLLEGPLDDLGERLARLYLAVWEGPARDRLIAILRSAMVHEDAARMIREFMTATMLDGIASQLDGDLARLRASLCASQVVGMGVLRGVLGFGPLVEADGEELVAWLAPTLQRYLTGPLPGHDG